MTYDKVALREAAAVISTSHSIAVLTGAGISTDSEIPDYRGPNGVWTKNPAAEKASTLRHYVADPEVRKAAWQVRVQSPIWDAKPNPGHYAIVELEQRRKLNLLVTQNVDGLHIKAGSDPDRLVEIHGSVRNVVCLKCDYRAPMNEALDRVRAGEPDPPCPDCSGILKSSTISFGQNLVESDLVRAQAAAESCDLLLAVGSTLSVGPINRMVPIARSTGAGVVIVNGEPTEMDHYADVVVNGSISDVLPKLLAPAAP
ncbi:MAG: Sir2 family NAD-dependent protein deacetylase [Acidimicrobiia bacterium]|nr:Sir2 family NAD-dependent protein deacetylase [Acidimicrobiia bacterium]